MFAKDFYQITYQIEGNEHKCECLYSRAGFGMDSLDNVKVIVKAEIAHRIGIPVDELDIMNIHYLGCFQDFT